MYHNTVSLLGLGSKKIITVLSYSSKLLKINARLQKKSQCSDDKIKAEEIIKSPPGTPKMVKAVIQVSGIIISPANVA